MMKTPTIKIILRTNHRRADGRQGIYLRFTLDRKTDLISLGLAAHPGQWDARRQRVRRSAPDSFNTNTLLDNHQSKAGRILLDYRIAGRHLSLEAFKRHFNDTNYGGKGLVEYAESVVRDQTATLSPSTVKGYREEVRKLRGFRPGAVFEEITPSWVGAYEQHLMGVSGRGNSRNTATKSLSFLRTVLNRAKRDGLIATHAFEQGARVGRIEGERSFLTLAELDGLHDLYRSGTLRPGLQSVLRYFLFACYTGLRYGDLKGLRHSNIGGDRWMTLKTKKTDEVVRVPLTPKALELIPPGTMDGLPVFRVRDNNTTNKHLREIMALQGIGKGITMHSGRHTFATCSLDLGIPLEVVSKIMGHTDTRTTAIYARIRDGLKEREMRKWESL